MMLYVTPSGTLAITASLSEWLVLQEWVTSEVLAMEPPPNDDILGARMSLTPLGVALIDGANSSIHPMLPVLMYGDAVAEHFVTT